MRFGSTAQSVIPAPAGIQSRNQAAVMRALLPTSQNDPSGLAERNAFWNSFSCDSVAG